MTMNVGARALLFAWGIESELLRKLYLQHTKQRGIISGRVMDGELDTKVQSETTSAREACKGCGGTGVVGALRITCPYCFGSGKSMYVVNSKSDAVAIVGPSGRSHRP